MVAGSVLQKQDSHVQNNSGKILVAHPNLPLNNPFRRSVVYCYQDNEAGAAGIVLNRLSKTTVQRLCQDNGLTFGDKRPRLYLGGPVNTQALVLLHTDDWTSTNTARAGDGLCVSSDNLMLKKIADGNEPVYWRLFLGMSGWSPGQLQAELNGNFPYKPENSWLTAKADYSILFETDGDDQWHKATQFASQQMFDSYL